MQDILKPEVSLLVKLGSIAVHAEEFLTMSPEAVRGHEHDRVAIQALLADPEVRDWIQLMDAHAFLPKKR